MKVKSIVLLVLMALPMVINAATTGKCTIKGQVEGLADNTKWVLVPDNTHRTEKPVAEAIVGKNLRGEALATKLEELFK